MDAQLLPLARLQHWADTTPQSVFLVQALGGGRYRHYSWLDARKVVGQIAGHLRSLGWPPGSCIAILGKNSAEWILADLGIWAAGHVSVPLYPAQTQQEINRVLAQCDARGCFVGKLDDASILASIDPHVQRILLPGAPAAEGLQWDQESGDPPNP